MFGSGITVRAAALSVILTAGLGAWVPGASAEIRVTRVNIGLPNTAVFVIRGGFDGNEILRFKTAVADIPPKVRVIAILNSPGGRVDQGYELGKFFTEAGIVTAVMAGDGACASACQMAFFGGRDPHTGKPLRILFEGGKLGFHNFKSSGLADREYTKQELINISKDAQQFALGILQYFQYVEAPIQVYQLFLGTKAESMNFISESQALDVGVSIVNTQTGTLISPENINRRTKPN